MTDSNQNSLAMKTRSLIILALSIISVAIGLKISHASEELHFFTTEEAKKLSLSEKEWNQLIIESHIGMHDNKLIPSSSISKKGPEIIIKTPPFEVDNTGITIETYSPTDLIISFIKTGSAIDIESLKVVAKKGFFSVSLTDRLKPYMEGTSINAKKIKIPKGKFLIQISIADLNGVETTKTIRMIVLPNK